MSIIQDAITYAKKVRDYHAVKRSEYFNSEWYRLAYGENIKNPARHYAETGWCLGFDPSEFFSTSAYFEKNPDVKTGAMNPLVHYELFGKAEGRKPEVNPNAVPVKAGVTCVNDSLAPENMKRCVIFASYSADGTIPDYVVYYLKELSKVTDGIVFIADNRLADKSELEKIEKYVFHADFCRHGTYDFGSWKRGLEFLKKEGLLSKLDELVLANDSCYGPVTGLEGIFNKMRSEGCDFWGLIDTKEPKYHLLSFFYAIEQNVLRDPSYLLRFFEKIGSEPQGFWCTVEKCEREFTLYLKEKYSCGCFIKNSETEKMALRSGNFNPALWPVTMLKNGLPFVKVKCLDGRFGRDCHENPENALAYVRKSNRELYGIINYDLKRRQRDITETLRSQIDDYSLSLEDKELVSFDVFDTLLTRPFCNPEDMFRYMERRYDAEGFANERQLAEKRARLDTDEPEVTLDSIYEHILPRYRAMKELELQTELECSSPNPNVKKLYEQAVALGKRVIALSDMYLPAEFIQRLLLEAGYDKIEKVFVSCEYNKTKGSGELYAAALEACGVSSENAIHFGDNPEADEACALKAGLNACRTAKLRDYFLDMPANVKYKCFYEQCGNTAVSVHMALAADYFARMKNNSLFFEALGYTLGGPFVLSYVYHLCREAKANGIDHLMFVARDGYILKQIYEKYFMPEYGIPCSYVYLNRAVVLKASEKKPQRSKYLKTLLELAKADGIPVEVFGETEEGKNRAEYDARLPELYAWRKENAARLKKHLELACGEAKSIAVVDMVTSEFTSLKGASEILGDRVSMGIFMGTYWVGSTVLPYWSFSGGDFDKEQDITVKFSEFLITSPEDSITGLNNSGEPIYEQAVDTGRKDRIAPILEGISSYCSDFLSRQEPCEENLYTFSKWAELIKYYVKYCNDADLHYLEGVTDTPNPIEKQESNSVADIIRELKKQGK